MLASSYIRKRLYIVELLLFSSALIGYLPNLSFVPQWLALVLLALYFIGVLCFVVSAVLIFTAIKVNVYDLLLFISFGLLLFSFFALGRVVKSALV